MVAALTVAPRPASADTLQQRRDQIRRERAQLQVQINLAVASDTRIQAEDARLARQVARQTAALDAARLDLAAAESRAADAQRRLADIEAHSAAVRHALVTRAVDLYEQPFQSQALAFTGAVSLNDYAERQAIIGALEGRTSDILDAFRQQHIDELAATKDLLRAKADADARRHVLQQEADNLSAAKASLDRTNAALEQRIKDLQFETAGLAAQESALEAKLAAAESSFAGSVPAVHGAFMWPLHGPVTREFGYQAGGFHPGIDIAPPFGTPIHASASGVVIYASWESGYGNYTCISHGGGISTCYAHQSAIYVSVGQSVRQGQVIGAEGSTGNSTGPHVHFEVRVNNAPENPRRFVPGNP